MIYERTKLLSDLEHILFHTKDLWEHLRGKTILITGGTGFFGKWLLESFCYANETLALNATAIVLSRNPHAFLTQCSWLQQSCLSFIQGDVTSFAFPEGTIDYIIHAATEASATLIAAQPLYMYDTIVAGTRHILELAKEKKVKSVLHTSSGAVYGVQPSEISHISEDYRGAPDTARADAAYGEGKRVAEMLAAVYHRQYGVPSRIARCFAFVGPYLPLDAHFAIGNFINNVIHQEDIELKGDGTPYRSYLYASDLAIWLWKILFEGAVMEPYNVGSDEDYSLEEIARRVAAHGQNTQVKIALPKSGNLPLRYVPSIRKAKELLHLEVTVPLELALDKTLNYYKN